MPKLPLIPMNVPSTSSCGRLGLLSVALLLSSCALPREEAWRIIRNDGLIPYIAIELGHRDQPAGNLVARPKPAAPASRYWESTPVATPVGTPPASIAARPSPSPILITRSADGTLRSTTKVQTRPKPLDSAPKSAPVVTSVPAPAPAAKPAVKSAAEALGAVKPAPAPVPAPAPAPAPAVAEIKPKAKAPEATKPKPAPETPVAQAAQKPPVNAKPTAVETPYGVPVAGRPGLVNSPYAGKLQLVDVTGLKPGQEVKCPYSGKLFRVPPGATAEAKQATDAPVKK